jgi:hypothetical protein
VTRGTGKKKGSGADSIKSNPDPFFLVLVPLIDLPTGIDGEAAHPCLVPADSSHDLNPMRGDPDLQLLKPRFQCFFDGPHRLPALRIVLDMRRS